jgi:Flp pilus assembly protein TadD
MGTAMDLLRRAQRHAPDDLWVNLELAYTLEHLIPPRREEAIRFYTAAQAVRPECGVMLGYALVGAGRKDEAVAVIREVARLRPTDPTPPLYLGFALVQAGDHEGGRAPLREALRLHPKSPSILCLLGSTLLIVGEDRDAERACHEALRLDPEYAESHLLLGRIEERRGRPDQAIAAFRDAVRLAPRNADAHITLGFALDRRGELDQAIQELREGLRLGPTANLELGAEVVLEAAEYTRKGRAILRESQALHREIEARDRAHEDLLDGAIAKSRAAVRLKPDDAVVHYNLGHALYSAVVHYKFRNALRSKGNLDEAIAEYRVAVRLKPDFAPAHNNLGNALHSRGDLDGAIEEYREAIRVKPDYALARTNLGNALRSRGDLDGAIEEYREAICLKPNDTRALDKLADALLAKGKVGEMVPVLQLAIEKKPDDPNLRHRLAVTLLLTNDREGYRRACAATVQRLGRSTDRKNGEAARSCLIGPEALDDLSVPRRLMELAEDRQTRSHWWLYVQGLAHYRAGEYEQAIECLTKSMEAGSTWWWAVALNWPVLAMAHHRLGHADEARRYLEKAHDTRGDKARDIQPGEVINSKAPWFDRAEFRVLLREAEELILGSSFPDDPFQP